MTKNKAFKQEINDSEHNSLWDLWERSEFPNPYHVNIDEFLSFSKRVSTSIEMIKESQNPRLIVLECWLIVDFTIRHLITVGLGIDRFFDDQTSPLPQSTKDCISILRQLIDDQRSKEVQSKLAIVLSSEFRSFIGKDTELLEKLYRYEDEFYRLHFPNYNGSYLPVNPLDYTYRQVEPSWIFRVSRINDEWFKIVESLNNVRNKAAHSFEVDEIYLKLGVFGNNKIKELKKKCMEILNKTIGIKLL